MRSTLAAEQWRGDTFVVLAAVHGILYRPGWRAVEPSLFLSPSPPPSCPSLISNLASVDVKQNDYDYGQYQSPGEIKRREVVLDPQVSPEEIKSREVELGSESWTYFASVVTQQ